MRYHLVHVGKCAGESVKRTLQPNIAELHTYHCGDAPSRLANLILKDDPEDAFIVLMRDPVARFVSAFEWDLQSKSVDGDGKAHKNPLWARVFRTFLTANDLAESLTCPEQERREAANHAFRASHLHIQFDLGWYLPPVIAARMPAGRTHLVWTERIEADMQALTSRLNLPYSGVIKTKEGYKERLEPERLTKSLTPTAQTNVRRASHASYATLSGLTARCGIPEQIDLLDRIMSTAA